MFPFRAPLNERIDFVLLRKRRKRAKGYGLAEGETWALLEMTT